MTETIDYQQAAILKSDMALIVPLRLVGTYAVYVQKVDGIADSKSLTVLWPAEGQKNLPLQVMAPKAPKSTRAPWVFVAEHPEEIKNVLRGINPHIDVAYLDGFESDEFDFDDDNIEKIIDLGDVTFDFGTPEFEVPSEKRELVQAMDLALSAESGFLFRMLNGSRAMASAIDPYIGSTLQRNIGQALQCLLRRDFVGARRLAFDVHVTILKESLPFYANRWELLPDWPKEDELSPQAMLQLVSSARTVLASLGEWTTLAPERFKLGVQRLEVATRMGVAALEVYRDKVGRGQLALSEQNQPAKPSTAEFELYDAEVSTMMLDMLGDDIDARKAALAAIKERNTDLYANLEARFKLTERMSDKQA